MKADSKTSLVLMLLTLAFLALGASFVFDLWGRSASLPSIPLVDPIFTNTSTVRLSAAEVIRTGGDASGLDCYACHDKSKPTQLHFDPEGNPLLPKEHEDIVMGHGRHNRNNHCFNCHDEANLELLQARDGRELKLVDSTPLCGSCHGPTYRDWEAGVHGRTGGFWTKSLGTFQREDCVSCHDPHKPKFPSQKPGPAPHVLHPTNKGTTQTGKEH